jgi:hypothetical protein
LAKFREAWEPGGDESSCLGLSLDVLDTSFVRVGTEHLAIDHGHDLSIGDDEEVVHWLDQHLVGIVLLRGFVNRHGELELLIDEDLDILVHFVKDIDLGLPGHENVSAYAGTALLGDEDLGEARVDEVVAMSPGYLSMISAESQVVTSWPPTKTVMRPWCRLATACR